MTSLGAEFSRPAPAEKPGKQVVLTLERDSEEMTDLLKQVSQLIGRLPELIEQSVARALTEQNLARRTVIHAPAPDLTDLEDYIRSLPRAATAQEIREALDSIVQPPRKVKRVVNRDQWGRIESVTEEDQ